MDEQVEKVQCLNFAECGGYVTSKHAYCDRCLSKVYEDIDNIFLKEQIQDLRAKHEHPAS